MANIVVGVGGIEVSKNQDDVIKTYALGSCVAVIAYSPQLRVAGLAHIALPDSSLGQEKARSLPGYFADTGVPVLIDKLKRLGVTKSNQLVIKLAGGANILDPEGKFNIGKRNVLAIRKILWHYRLGALAEDVGDSFSRTVSVNVRSGEVIISSPKKSEWKL